MSTPDSSGLPTETAIGSGQIPHLGEAPLQVPSAGASTPGVALAGARFPGGPTGLSADAPELALFIAELANAAFRAPPAGEDIPAAAAPTAAQVPSSVASSPGSSPFGTSVVGASSGGAPSVGASSGGAPSVGAPSGGAPSVGAPSGASSVPGLPTGSASLGAPSFSAPLLGSPSVGGQGLPLPAAELGGLESAASAGSVSAPAAVSQSTLLSPTAPASFPGARSSELGALPSALEQGSLEQGSLEQGSLEQGSARLPSPGALDGDIVGAGGPLGGGLSLPALDALAQSGFRSETPGLEANWPLLSAPTQTVGGVPYWAPTEPAGAQAVTVGPAAEASRGRGAPQLDQQAPRVSKHPFDAYAIRAEFPILNERVNGKRLVWLDNAATTQKPKVVIERLSHYYEHENSNIHRAAHTLAARATDAYESARESVRRFINAPSKNDIIFVRGATEGINFIAQSWGRRNVRAGDEIVLTQLEHHANIVPWHRLCSEVGARIVVVPTDEHGRLILEEYERLLSDKTRLVAFTQVSNALGTVTPAAEMIALAHRYGARVLLDGAQAVSHKAVDVQALDCDFFVFSGHKVFAPTGIGAVFGKREVLEVMPPWQGGGNMIQDVTFERIVYQGPPARFEAGTGNIADAVGLGAALDWLTEIGLHNVERYEHELLEYGTERLLTVPGLRLIGTAPEKAGVLSFVLAGQKTEEVGGLLDQEGIAVRSGHHCAQPILRRFGLEATVRASLAPYNTFEDLDALVAALQRLQAGQVTHIGS